MNMKYILPLLLLFTLHACQSDTGNGPSDAEIIEDFKTHFFTFYETYADMNPDFVDYYAKDVINMDNKGEVMIGSETYRDVWTETFQKYEIDLLDYTDPEIIYSREQIVTYNDYDELFISMETRDTVRVRGTWIAVWKPVDDKWLVTMNTFHIKDQR